MKWSLMFKEKMKAATILVILMLAIILSNLLEKRLLKTSDQTVSSIYEDRLSPSTDLFEMRTLNDQLLFVLDELSHANTNTDKIRLNAKVAAIQNSFGELLKKYEATFLVAEEKVLLTSLKGSIIQLNQNFSNFKAIPDLAISNEIKADAKNLMVSINENLAKLNRLQSEIGQQMLKDYKSDTYYSSFLNTFQIILSIIIGMIILNMVSSARILDAFDKKKINLN